MKNVEKYRKENFKVIFAHDHKLKKYEENYYSTGGLGDYVTHRYSDIFGNIELICRSLKIEVIDEKLTKITNPNVHINAIEGTNLFLSLKKLNIIRKCVKNSDGIIARLPSVIGLCSLYYAKKYNKPYLIEVVADTFGSYWYKSILGKIVALPLNYIVKKTIEKSEYTLYVTKDFLQKKYPNNKNTCGCSDVLIENQTKEVLLKRLDKIEKSDYLTLGTLGQIDISYKGHKYVIKAISNLKKRGIKIKYKLAGSGNISYLKKIIKKENVEELVEFCGVISHEKVYSWIDSLDIYIQPSKTEGMPRAVIEAISRGCPTLVSSAGGMYELVESNYTFSTASVNQIQNLLIKLKKEDLKEMSIKNFNKGKEFEPTLLAEKREKFYKLFRSKLSEEKINEMV